MMKVAPCQFRMEKPGKFTDKYETMELIGIGGYGVVKKAKNMKTNEVRAVKVIAKDKCQTTSAFSDEIRILQKLVLFIDTVRIIRTW